MTTRTTSSVDEDLVDCPYCNNGVHYAELMTHLDACADTAFDNRRRQLNINPDIASLFRPRAEAPQERESQTAEEAAAASAAALEEMRAHEVTKGVYIGSVTAAVDVNWLRSAGVRAIINCAQEVDELSNRVREEAGIVFYTKLSMDDTSRRDLTHSIQRGASVVQEALRVVMDSGGGGAGDGALLVHCAMGISRSVSVVLAYMVMHGGMSLCQAAKLVFARRPMAYPNVGFWRSLRTIELDATGVSSVPEDALQLHAESLGSCLHITS